MPLIWAMIQGFRWLEIGLDRTVNVTDGGGDRSCPGSDFHVYEINADNRYFIVSDVNFEKWKKPTLKIAQVAFKSWKTIANT